MRITENRFVHTYIYILLLLLLLNFWTEYWLKTTYAFENDGCKRKNEHYGIREDRIQS